MIWAWEMAGSTEGALTGSGTGMAVCQWCRLSRLVDPGICFKVSSNMIGFGSVIVILQSENGGIMSDCVLF